MNEYINGVILKAMMFRKIELSEHGVHESQIEKIVNLFPNIAKEKFNIEMQGHTLTNIDGLSYYRIEDVIEAIDKSNSAPF
jgi:hypothetical protein